MGELKHIGVPMRSGRYPWGSGQDPFQRVGSFKGHISELRKRGLSDVDIAKGLGMNTSQLRARLSLDSEAERAGKIARAIALRDEGHSVSAIARIMGLPNESSVRSMLNPSTQERAKIATVTADILKNAVKDKTFVDIGEGVENHMGVSRTKLDTAVARLREEGYELHYLRIEQQGTGKFTTMKVLCPPGTPYQDLMAHKDDIQMPTDYSEDGGRTFLGIKPPVPISADRVGVRFAEDGGVDKDGVIEIRRGVPDLNMDQARYAQVRINVADTHYLKGMAMYSDDLPAGVDILFNTNKHSDVPVFGDKKNSVLKPLKDDPDNPFGATVRQKTYIGPDGKEHLSGLNIVYDEGKWEEWSRSISSQVLSKQPTSLAEKQLGLAYSSKADEYAGIMKLTNPAVRSILLKEFSDDCDAASVNLKAAALPRQASHVILPFPKINENEVYAPNYRDGERVVLIRHPHGGVFEIPELTVNNRFAEAREVIGNAKDAVGIHPKVAQQLSGADFDGDSVIVIPNNSRAIRTAAPLIALKNFDPKESYPERPGMKVVGEKGAPKTDILMGKVSNLITDMTIKGATLPEIARAVKHSMVVIDAEKHRLDYKASEIENGIPALKAKYQGGKNAGASTIISRAKSEARVDERKEYVRIDKETGEKIFTPTGNTYIDKDGRVVVRQQESTKMAETKDARTLSSGTDIERVYADHANKLKALANTARKAMVNTVFNPRSSSAAKAFASEIASLNGKLNMVMMRKPLERKAQLVSGSVVKAKREAKPDMDKKDIKRLRSQALSAARMRYRSEKDISQINLTEREWLAIQAGAISKTKLLSILQHVDKKQLRELATPRDTVKMSPTMIARAKSMLANDVPRAEIARALGVSTTTISEFVE